MQGSERQDFGHCLPVREASDNVASPHVFQRAPRAPPAPPGSIRRRRRGRDLPRADRVALLTATGPAKAAPLDEPFVGGLSFTGPTSANLGAVYWNPAALGLVRGFQLMVAGSGRLSTIDVNRTPIDPRRARPRRRDAGRLGAGAAT